MNLSCGGSELRDPRLCFLHNFLLIESLRDAGMHSDDLGPFGKIGCLLLDLRPDATGVDICFGKGDQADDE